VEHPCNPHGYYIQPFITEDSEIFVKAIFLTGGRFDQFGSVFLSLVLDIHSAFAQRNSITDGTPISLPISSFASASGTSFFIKAVTTA
jgi:hypothetical protein